MYREMMTRKIQIPLRVKRLALLLLAILSQAALPATSLAGGAGRDVPPFVLPVRETELRVITQARMVCVDDPAIACQATYLDAKSASVNSDGGTFRSASCPGVTPGACRPDFIDGAEITGELVVDWEITRLPEPFCGSSPAYEICHSGNIALNVTAPGVTVSNPLVERSHLELGENECICIDEPAYDSDFDGARIAEHWRTRNVEASCDVAIEHAGDDFLPRDRILTIGQRAFPSLLCQPDANGACTIDPVLVFVEPDGTLTKGCGSPPPTFAIRFAHRNEPLAFVRRDLPASPMRDIEDVNADGAFDIVPRDAETLYRNLGGNRFAATSSGLPSVDFRTARITDWTDDGHPDIVARPNFPSEIRIYEGDSSGMFNSSPIVESTTTPGDLVAVADLNGDDRPEVLSRDSSLFPTSYLVWNETGGAISSGSESLSFQAEALVDLDSDTDPDVIGSVSGSPAEVHWASNEGPGGFSGASLADVPTASDELVSILGQEVVDILRCDEYTSDCCTAHGGLGCDDAACEAIVCGPNDTWDGGCRDEALQKCAACMPAGQPDCCVERPGQLGCELTACEDIVCAIDANCCGNEWDRLCADTARGRCSQCFGYSVLCSTEIADVTAADADADGDVDLFVSLEVDLDLLHDNQNRSEDTAFFAWIPNLQVDDPPASGGQPLFDPAVEPWRLLGRTATSGSSIAASQIEAVDLDGDGDPDAVGTGSWYRNEGGTFTGPYALGLGSTDQGCGVDGLLAHWRFDGSADDATRCDQDGTLQGPVPAPDLDGAPDRAYAFDGIDDRINAGNDPTLDPELPLTFSAWVRHDCAGLCRIFANDVVSGAAYSGFWLNLDSGGRLAAGIGDGTGAGSSDRRSALGSAVVTVNAWHHVVVTVVQSGSVPNFDFFIDGIPDTVTQSGTGGPLGYLGNDALIGATSAGTAPFEGTLDDIRLYGRALGESEILALLSPADPVTVPGLDPEESLSLAQLIVEDIDGDGDVDVVGDTVLWESVPEPGLGLLLASGLVGLLLRARNRLGRSASPVEPGVS